MRQFGLLAAVSCCALLPSQQAHGEWASDWISHNGHDYRLTIPMPWQDAEALAVSVGGHLVTIRSASENQWLYDTFSPISPDPYFAFATGLHQAPNSPEPAGGWGWVSGELVTFVNWSTPYEPNNAPNGGLYEDVAHVFGPNGVQSLGVPSMWNDYPSSMSVPALVEVVPEPATLSLLALGGLMIVRRRRSS